MSRAIVFMADGTEECEALLVADLLRRAKVEVSLASASGRLEIVSSHQVRILADVLAEDADYENADIVVLPGGIPGTPNLAASLTVSQVCRDFAANRRIAAVCAAPSVLAGLGLLEGKRATCHPNFEDRMHGAVLTHDSVTVDGNIITGQGLGATIPFALEIVATLQGREEAERVKKAICYRG